MLEQELLQELKELRRALPLTEFVGIPFLAKKLGVSTEYLRVRYWLQPDWGKSEVPGKALWRRSTVNTWLDELSPQERESRWVRLTAAEKKGLSDRRGRP